MSTRSATKKRGKAASESAETNTTKVVTSDSGSHSDLDSNTDTEDAPIVQSKSTKIKKESSPKSSAAPKDVQKPDPEDGWCDIGNNKENKVSGLDSLFTWKTKEAGTSTEEWFFGCKTIIDVEPFKKDEEFWHATLCWKTGTIRFYKDPNTKSLTTTIQMYFLLPNSK